MHRAMKAIGVMLLMIGLLTTVFGAAFAEEEVYTDVYEKVPYLDDEAAYHITDIYGAKEKTEATKTILEIHGGAFFGGSEDTNIDHSIFYADAGFIVFTPDYGKVPRHGDFSDTIRDLFAFYNWVYDHAEEYHVDLNQISISGDSAGGYYVLITDAIWHSPELQKYFQVTVPDFTFAAVIATCPETDLLELREKLEQGDFVANKIGADIIHNADLMTHLDLYTNVEPQIFEGLYIVTTPTDDTTGPSTMKFHQYLTDENVEHTLASYDGVENELKHVFNINKASYAESIQANQDIVDFINACLK